MVPHHEGGEVVRKRIERKRGIEEEGDVVMRKKEREVVRRRMGKKEGER